MGNMTKGQKMEIGSKVIIREAGAFFGEEGIVVELPQAQLKGPGFDLSVPVEHQTAAVKIFGGALGVFVKPADLELVEN